MARNNQYPIILGMTPPNKQGIGIKSKYGAGYDLYILNNDLSRQYAVLHFASKKGIASLKKQIEKFEGMRFE